MMFQRMFPPGWSQALAVAAREHKSPDPKTSLFWDQIRLRIRGPQAQIK
jgi:hypothetical protein